MTMRDCINSAVAADLMDRERADEALEIFEDMETSLRRDADGATARPDEHSSRAAERTIEAIKAEKSRKRWQQFKQIAAEREKEIGIKGAKDSGEAAIGAIDSDGAEIPYVSAKQHRDVVQSKAQILFADILVNFRRTMFGNTRDKANLTDMTREAFGESTGNPVAKAFAEAWYDTAEFLRHEFNKAGGALAKLERWGMPQMHDLVKIRGSTVDQWIDFVMPKLDRARMIDRFTGQPFTDDQMRVALEGVHEAIRTEGQSRLKPSGTQVSRSRANSRIDHRFLHFRNADDWLAYQDRFGTGDVFSSMQAHIERMSRDIGEMRALGPNPAKTVRFMENLLDAEAKKLEGGGKVADRKRNKLDANRATLKGVYDQYTGTANAPVDGIWAQRLRDVRQVITSAVLGAAQLTAISDLNFGRIAAKSSGLPAAKVMMRHLKLLTPHVSGDQKIAIKLGLIADNMMQIASAQQRYIGEVVGSEGAQRLSDGILRASGLSPWTQAGRWAFGMEFMSALADHSNLRFADLPADMQKSMTLHRISAADWDVVRNTSHFEPDAGGFIRPADIADEAIGTRIMAMIQQETEFAVPTASLRGRATFAGSTRPGTASGEILRSGLMFKNFAITMYFTHLRRMASQVGAKGKFAYGGNLIIGATLMGAFAIQLKEISKGRDPMPMFLENGLPDPAFWSMALLQGGGLGIFGDFALADQNRFGGGIGETIAGPVIALGSDLSQATVGNLMKLVKGKDTHVARDVSRLLKTYTPGTSLWYTRLAVERLLWDQIEAFIDPDAQSRFDRAMRRQEREKGNGYFAPRGQRLPDRLPDLTNIVR